EYYEAALNLRPFLTDTGAYLREQLASGKNMLFESANGIHLDVDHGTF
ncbi:unnamed protein product, partial [marine sediment metagenome]